MILRARKNLIFGPNSVTERPCLLSASGLANSKYGVGNATGYAIRRKGAPVLLATYVGAIAMPTFLGQNPPTAPGQTGWPLGQVAIPALYFNGFALNLAASDVSLLALLDGQPQMRLSMSFTTAKTLSSLLTELIGKLEAATGRDIMKADEVSAGLQKLEAGQE